MSRLAEPVDLLVVGGGPAGLATALGARRRGLSVTLLDRCKPPQDKACGEGLMPDGQAALGRLGVCLDPCLGWPFGGIRYIDHDPHSERRIAEGRFPGLPGLGLRRPVLHQQLARAAEEQGVRCLWGCKATGPVGTGTELRGVETDGGSIEAHWILGADGLHSRVRRWAGLERPHLIWPRQAPQRFGVRRHYGLSPWADAVEVHWGAGAEAYVTPVARDEVGVAILWSGRKASFDQLLQDFPTLAARLAGAEVRSQHRGAGPLQQRVRRVARGRVALVGDAAGYVDAITGEGLSLALHQAEALANCLAADDLASYPKLHRSIGRIPGLLTRLMLMVEGRPWLRRRVVKVLADDPALFSHFLAVLARQRAAGSLATVLPRLVRGLLVPRERHAST